MKPRTFGQAFAAAFSLGWVIFFLLSYFVLEDDQLRVVAAAYNLGVTPLGVRAFFAGVGALGIGVSGGLNGRGIILERKPENQRKYVEALTVALAERGYTAGVHTDSLVSFVPPLKLKLFGAIHAVISGDRIQVVGPYAVLNKLRQHV